MKLAVGFLLVLFITYLSTPSIVSLIDNSNDVTLTIDSIDEDQNDLMKIHFKSVSILFFSTQTTKVCNEICFRNILKRTFLSYSIFIPPPERA
jgi:hypothetical protein